jgi:hypothetical protein
MLDSGSLLAISVSDSNPVTGPLSERGGTLWIELSCGIKKGPLGGNNHATFLTRSTNTNRHSLDLGAIRDASDDKRVPLSLSSPGPMMMGDQFNLNKMGTEPPGTETD